MSIFEETESTDDGIYKKLATSSHPVAEETRIFLNSLWVTYEKYSDTNFKKEIRSDFYARYWEMYLTCVLLNRGFTLQCPKPGPDILTKNNPEVWIEAIAPNSGNPDLPDSVPPVKYGDVQSHPSDQIILRYRAAIREKYDNKYCHYRRKGIISETDPYVIAVSSCKIQIASLHPPVPEIIKSVFPLGFQQIHIGTKDGEVVGHDYQYRAEIKKECGSPVSTDIFLDPHFKHLSGVLYSSATPANNHNLDGIEYMFVHNPNAVNKIPENYFNFGKEYIAKASETHYELAETDHCQNGK